MNPNLNQKLKENIRKSRELVGINRRLRAEAKKTYDKIQEIIRRKAHKRTPISSGEQEEEE